MTIEKCQFTLSVKSKDSILCNIACIIAILLSKNFCTFYNHFFDK